MYLKHLIFFGLLTTSITPISSALAKRALNPALKDIRFIDKSVGTVYQKDMSFKKIELEFKNITKLMNELIQISQKPKFKILAYVKKGGVLRGIHLDTLLHLHKSALGLIDRSIKLAKLITKDKSADNIKQTFLIGNQQKIIKDLAWLSIHLQIIDFTKDFYTDLYHNKKTRRVLNTEESSYNLKSNQLFDLYETIYNFGYHQVISSSLNKFFDNQKRYDYLAPRYSTLIHTSSALNHIIMMNKERIQNKKDEIDYFRGIDGLAKGVSNTTNFISQTFGNTIGLVKTRKGYMYNSIKMMKNLSRILKPLDMISENTPFALTDKFIPGVFGHIAIYLGTEKQLKEIGMWDHPIMKPYQEVIRKGYVIFETLRQYSDFNTIKGFLNIDSIAIYRLNNLYDNVDKMAHIYKMTFQQRGKKYDFNFDSEYSDKLVCSELIYHAFGDINWPTVSIVGRNTISPDNIASLAFYKNSPLELVNYIKSKGKNNFYYAPKKELAEDLGLVFHDGEFKSQKRKCKTNRSKIPHNKQSQKRICTTIYTELDYAKFSSPQIEMDEIENFSNNILFNQKLTWPHWTQNMDDIFPEEDF